MGDVTVVVATFGDPHWCELADERAVPSAEAEGVRVVRAHGGSLHEARNGGLGEVDTEFVVFLDADDELSPGYCAHLLTGSADVRVPAVSYVKSGRGREPYVPNVAWHTHQCSADCLEAGNWAVVGSMARTAHVRAVRGFRGEELYEDWSLWLRMFRNGSTFQTMPGAVYRAHWRADSRNRGVSTAVKDEWHRRILDAA